MQKFTIETGIVAPLDRANIDTDAIIPKQFLKSIKRTGFGDYLFDEWRFLDVGSLDKPLSERQPNPSFVLNIPAYKNAIILLTRENFGCGSSREHAPWALSQYGFRAIIAPSFADIFYSNAFKNGLLLITLDPSVIDDLFQRTKLQIGLQLTIDLPSEEIRSQDGGRWPFSISPFHKDCLINGLDDIGLTLQHCSKIKEYEKVYLSRCPWVNL